ncbi:site-specific DNA-methyltransferase [Flavobacterium dankookense]|uniref:Methyltransferase n=1 Tax=Flavobacterium dankookense TaxID=706186 RepID=A0A4R6Q751_9FLAO|nr:site-specific DNA-methyltransferase [Flavobacterium dankookense]TDP57443.1 site-specific DNA-methyltransferase (adenine-specific)/modification methylase [Flavobacterium dankookense]
MSKLGSLAINTIHQGDCIALLKKIPDNSVDLIFADPPYNLQLNGELTRPNQTKVDAVNDAWDKFESMAIYDQFTNDWLKECKRILKTTGSIWVIGTYHNIFRVGAKLQDLGFWMLNDVVWIKSNPMPNFKGTRFNNAHETMLWATKSEKSKYTFHYHSMKTMNEDLQMRSDWLIPICQGDERIKVNGQKAHSTQKPEELLYRVILSTSNVGDIVLDPFSGSGTTAAVAKKLGRNFIAFEREQFYIDVANNRLKEIVPIKDDLLEYKVEVKKPKVPFVNLIDKGFINVGDFVFSKDKKYKAQIQADSSLESNGFVGSIHKVSAQLLGKESNNGWTYWYVKQKGKLILIDDLREDFAKQYLK